jgi:PBP1b-binding outer membrane lipoprotein LpoB
MKRFLILMLFGTVLLSACSAQANDQQVKDEGKFPIVTVYKSPT